MIKFFDIKPETTDPTEALLVVINGNGESRCLMFDRVIGKQEVVIKSIGGIFRNTPAIRLLQIQITRTCHSCKAVAIMARTRTWCTNSSEASLRAGNPGSIR